MKAAVLPWSSLDRLRAAAFVARCTGSALLAAMAASAIGLGHPIWAVVSALAVSQDSAMETRRSFIWRIAATARGGAGGVVVGLAFSAQTVEIAVAVTICAEIARRWPGLRVCMWTAPIVLMTTTPGGNVIHAAIERGSEVVLGATIATAIHIMLDQALCRRAVAAAAIGLKSRAIPHA